LNTARLLVIVAASDTAAGAKDIHSNFSVSNSVFARTVLAWLDVV
jgi:Ca2+/Na+ antiporter